MALIVAVLMVAVLLAVLVYMMGIVVFYTFLLVVSFAHLRRTYRLDDWEPYEELLDVSYAKPVSILVPAYNEEAGIVGSVRSLLSIEYPEYEVIVINDGSTDRTLERLVEHFGLRPVYRVVRRQLATKEIKTIYRSSAYPHLFVLDKENGGKADALNAGINVARYPYICSIDGDSVLERRAFLKVMKPMIESDGEVIASGGEHPHRQRLPNRTRRGSASRAVAAPACHYANDRIFARLFARPPRLKPL